MASESPRLTSLTAELGVVDDPADLPPTTPRHLLAKLGILHEPHAVQQAALDAWFANPDADYPSVLVGMLERRGFVVRDGSR